MNNSPKEQSKTLSTALSKATDIRTAVKTSLSSISNLKSLLIEDEELARIAGLLRHERKMWMHVPQPHPFYKDMLFDVKETLPTSKEVFFFVHTQEHWCLVIEPDFVHPFIFKRDERGTRLVKAIAGPTVRWLSTILQDTIEMLETKDYLNHDDVYEHEEVGLDNTLTQLGRDNLLGKITGAGLHL